MKQTYAYISLVILLVALTLGGCAAPKPYVSNPKVSEAQNIIRAAGAAHNLDVVAPDNGSSASTVAGAVAHSLSHGGSLLTSPGLRGGADLLASLVLGSKDPETHSQIIAWMPKEMASSALDAKEKLSAIISEAMWKGLNDTPFPNPFTPAPTKDLNTFFVDGPGCVNKRGGTPCVYDYLLTDPKILPSPAFLGGSDSWAWTMDDNGGRSHLSPSTFTGDTKPHFPDYQVYKKMSANLPEWVFIYLAPSYGSWRVSVERQDGTFGYLSMPVVLNQGKTLYFLKRK